MALIKCSECGREISDKASSCPNCGAPVKAAGCVVHFERPKRFTGSAVAGPVFIDGQRVGTASNGCSFDVEVSYGQHSVEFETSTAGSLGMNRSNSNTLDIPAGAKRVDVTIGFKTDAVSFFGGGAKLAIVDTRVIR